MSFKTFMDIVSGIALCGVGVTAGMGEYDISQLLMLWAILLTIQRETD